MVRQRQMPISISRNPLRPWTPYDQALERDPENPDIIYKKGIALFSLRKYEEALCRPLARFSGSIPEFTDAQFHRGLVFIELGNLNEAVNAFLAVTEQDPENIPALYCHGYNPQPTGQV